MIKIFSSYYLGNIKNNRQDIAYNQASTSGLDFRFFKLSFVAIMMFIMTACSGVSTKPDVERNEVGTTDGSSATVIVDAISLQDYQQAIAFIENKKFVEADRLLVKVIDKYPDLAAPQYNLGVIAESQKDLESAVEFYNRAIVADKNYYLAYNNLGIIARTQGDFDQAFNYYNSGLKVAPNNTELNYNMAVLNEIYLHNYRKAIEHYERYLASFDDSSTDEPDKNVSSWIKDLERRSR